jgi:hypothetical protein
MQGRPYSNMHVNYRTCEGSCNRHALVKEICNTSHYTRLTYFRVTHVNCPGGAYAYNDLTRQIYYTWMEVLNQQGA